MSERGDTSSGAIAREIVDSAEDGYVVFDRQRKVIYANAAAGRLSGLSKAELQVLCERSAYPCEEFFPASQKHCELSIRSSAQGRLTLRLRDTTERKWKQDRRDLSRRQLAQFLKTATRVVGETDLQGLLAAIAGAARTLTRARVAAAALGFRGNAFGAHAVARAGEDAPVPALENLQEDCGPVCRELIGGPNASVRLTEEQLGQHAGWGARGLVAVRLVDKSGIPDGVIIAAGNQQGEFSDFDESVLRNLGVIASFALQLIQARAKVESQAASLRASERLYRAIGESIDYGVWVCAPDGRNTYASESFLKLVGQTQEQCSNFGWGDVLHPEDSARTIAAWRECVRTGGTWDIEHRFRGLDGQFHHILARGVPVHDDKGEIICWAGINLDIDRLKKTEQALRENEQLLRESEQRFKSLAEHVPSILVRYDHNLRVVYLSPGAEEATGIPSERFIGRTNREMGIPEHLCRLWEDAIERVFHTGAQQDLEFDLPAPAGPRTHVLKLAPEFGPDGHICHVLGISTDITDRKQAEEKIRQQNAILRGINRLLAGALSCDTEQELGHTCLSVAEEVTGSKFGFIGEINAEGRLDDIAISDPGWIACRMEAGKRPPLGFRIHGIYGRVLLDGKGFYTNDPSSHPDRIGIPEGHPPLTAFLGVPLIRDGRTIGMIGLGNREGGYRPEDLAAAEALSQVITEVVLGKRAEVAVRASEERLRQAQKMESIGLLAGGIAHDFNNLLVGVVGNASLAEDLLPSGSPARELLRRIVHCGEQAANLTRQMLAYAGKGRFVLEPVNLSGIAGEAGALLQGSISKKITINIHPEPNLPAVQSDPSQMQQIFLNLGLNAAEAIGSAPGVISITTGVVNIDAAAIHEDLAGWPIEPGRCVFLEVHDTGCGMDATTRAKIFDPFFSTKFQGRGLGLAAVAGIVRAHKGAIRLTTAPGAGSTFRVLLPAMKDAPPAAPPVPPRQDLKGQGTVLVVDDEVSVREVARSALELRGYEVLLAESGRRAIEMVAEAGNRIRLVVLDLSMPEMSGEEVLPEIRRLQPDLDVIVSSGYSEAETMQLFAGMRVAGFIQKPYTVRDLARTVKAALA